MGIEEGFEYWLEGHGKTALKMVVASSKSEETLVALMKASFIAGVMLEVNPESFKNLEDFMMKQSHE